VKQAKHPFALILTGANCLSWMASLFFALLEQLRQGSDLTAEAKVIVLASAGQRDDAARRRELGVAASSPSPPASRSCLTVSSAF